MCIRDRYQRRVHGITFLQEKMSESRDMPFSGPEEHEMKLIEKLDQVKVDKFKVEARKHQSMGIARKEELPNTRKMSYDIQIYKAYGGGVFDSDSDDEGIGGEKAFAPSAEVRMQTVDVQTRTTVAGVNSFSQTYFFLVKGFLGSGMLTLPMGFCNGGSVFSVLCMGVVCFISITGMSALLEIRTKLGGSFSDIANEAIGCGGKAIINISLALCQIGHGTVYIIFISENLRAITEKWGCEVPVWAGALICFVVILPMVIVRDISKLSPLMIIATVIMLVTILAVVFFSASRLATNGIATDFVWSIKTETCLIFIGMSAFLYGKIGIVIPIRDLMQKKTEFQMCLNFSLWTIFGIFAGFGLIAYIAFGRNPDMVAGGGMITLALDQGNYFVQAVELFFMISLIPSFALMIYVPIKIWEKGMCGDWPRSCGRTWLRNLGRTLAVAGICYFAVVSRGIFDRVMAIFGSLFGGPLTFVWPAIFHLKLLAETPWQKMKNVFLILFGLTASGFTLSIAINKIMHPPQKQPLLPLI
eukprot:TRINITY_DN18166_c0_g1_i1.p1 TRINITY_DN18166_c0_g1~~TRINITY_DN18166_c0_g1_i1.p1  ORF type:complete len:529 (+),score=75.77 TRINITY_DN18166_c0_g1_i1:65-1651(+)